MRPTALCGIASGRDVLRPSDSQYETARGIWNGMVARHKV